jgi:TetR/AcrR family transcriptional regulator, transcriptional repressor of aconitase
LAVGTSRRNAIIVAARACFWQYGYAKTSLDDIARRAGISRPLIYRTFANKDAIFGAVYDAAFVERYPAVQRALATRGSKRERLLRVCDALYMVLWAEVLSSPMAGEFYDACTKIAPAIHATHDRAERTLLSRLLGSAAVAEVFQLAVSGLMLDMPRVRVLRKRLVMLVEQFAGAAPARARATRSARSSRRAASSSGSRTRSRART